MVLDSGFILTLPPLHVVHPGMQGCPSCLFSSASPRTHHLPLQGSSSSMTQRMIAARRLMTSTWPEPLAPLLLCCLFVGTNCIALLHPTSRRFVHHVCGRAEGKVGGSGDKKKKNRSLFVPPSLDIRAFYRKKQEMNKHLGGSRSSYRHTCRILTYPTLGKRSIFGGITFSWWGDAKQELSVFTVNFTGGTEQKYKNT